MSESLILLSESLIHSYFSKKQVISSEFRIPNPVSNICAEQASSGDSISYSRAQQAASGDSISYNRAQQAASGDSISYSRAQ